MARTIRTKVYKFNELSQESKSYAIKAEIAKFSNYFATTPVASKAQQIDAIRRINAYEYEFTREGKMFHS